MSTEISIRALALPPSLLQSHCQPHRAVHLYFCLRTKSPQNGNSPDTCPFRKSYPDVPMMEAGQDSYADNRTDALDGPGRACIVMRS